MRKSAIYLGTTLKDTLDSRRSTFNHDRLFDSQWKLQRLVSKPGIQWLLATDVYKAFCQKESCVFCHLQPKSNLLNKQLKSGFMYVASTVHHWNSSADICHQKAGLFPSPPVHNPYCTLFSRVCYACGTMWSPHFISLTMRCKVTTEVR